MDTGFIGLIGLYITDYDAPVSECGDVTGKYAVLRNLLKDQAADSISKQNKTEVAPL